MTDQKLKEMRMVARYAFSMYDAHLYLNSHPDCEEARNHFFEMNDKFMHAKEEYECKYGPLTANSDENRDFWRWSTEAWPWQIDEGGCDICGRM